MARKNRTSPLENIVIIASKFPWWIFRHSCRRSLPYFSCTPLPKPRQYRSTNVSDARAFLVPALLIGPGISAFNTMKRRKLTETVKLRADAASLNENSWSEFETLVPEHFKRKEFMVAREDGSGSAGCIDLVLHKGREKYLVQYKNGKNTKSAHSW